MRHISLIMAALFAAMCVTAGMASASNKAFDMTVVPQTSFVSSGSNVTVNYSVTNNTSADATCSFQVTSQANGFIIDVPLGTVYSHNSAGGQLSTPAVTKNDRITFELDCNGLPVASRTINVKVR